MPSVDTINKQLLSVIEQQLGKGSTNNKQLDRYGKSLFGKRYIGTFTADTVPDIPVNHMAIVNLDKSGRPGTHWVALVKDRKDRVIVYDSYGRKTKKILPDLYGRGNTVDTEYDAEQTKEEENCGARCMAALVMYDLHGANTLLKL